MCIILTCEKNVRPSRDLIETCFDNNPDGAGIMWVEGGMVQTSKGFMDEFSLISAIESVPMESPLVIHMRIATSGGVNVGTCHPFPVCRDLDTLHAANVVCHAAVAHNGIIAGVPTDSTQGISDTVYFVSHDIANMWRHDNKVTRKMRRRLASAAPNNRFAIMTECGDVFRIGDGWETVSRGIQASNSTWRYTWRSYKSVGNWRDWDWDWDSDKDYDGYAGESGYFWDKTDREYAAAVDRMCPFCEFKSHCRQYGAVCDDVAAAIDDELFAAGTDHFVVDVVMGDARLF